MPASPSTLMLGVQPPQTANEDFETSPLSLSPLPPLPFYLTYLTLSSFHRDFWSRATLFPVHTPRLVQDFSVATCKRAHTHSQTFSHSDRHGPIQSRRHPVLQPTLLISPAIVSRHTLLLLRLPYDGPSHSSVPSMIPTSKTTTNTSMCPVLVQQASGTILTDRSYTICSYRTLVQPSALS